MQSEEEINTGPLLIDYKASVEVFMRALGQNLPFDIADLVIDSEHQSPDEAAMELFRYLHHLLILKSQLEVENETDE
jgi:hypothetical protein